MFISLSMPCFIVPPFHTTKVVLLGESRDVFKSVQCPFHSLNHQLRIQNLYATHIHIPFIVVANILN